MHEGVAGLLRDKTRPSRIPPLEPEVTARVVELTQADPPGEITHWTPAAMAALAKISVSSVQRIWRAYGLQPHRIRQFKLSRDPEFVPKLRDIVELYVDPPAHAIVLSADLGLVAQCRRGLLRSAPNAASSAASSTGSSTSRPLSNDSSPRPMTTQTLRLDRKPR